MPENSMLPPHPPPRSRGADTTLTEQLAERFKERTRQRLLAPGARLPSVRECAQRHRVSPHTVVAAYDQLLALGLVEPRKQRGFFVRESTQRAALERVMTRLAAARERTVKLAETHGCRFASPPRGLFGWVDVGIDTERLAQVMLDEWLLAPGALFHATHRPTTLMCLNFATSQDLRFRRALDRARNELRGLRPAIRQGKARSALSVSGRYR